MPPQHPVHRLAYYVIRYATCGSPFLDDWIKLVLKGFELIGCCGQFLDHHRAPFIRDKLNRSLPKVRVREPVSFSHASTHFLDQVSGQPLFCEMSRELAESSLRVLVEKYTDSMLVQPVIAGTKRRRQQKDH